MQDEVRKSYKYEISVSVVDGPEGPGKTKAYDSDEPVNLNVKVSFVSDKYCSREYLNNLRKALHAIGDHETTKHMNRVIHEEVDALIKPIRERNINEKLHKKTD